MGVQAMKHAALLREWTARFAECRSSEMSVRAWCEAQGLSIKAYSYWEKRVIAQANQEASVSAQTRAGALMRVNPDTQLSGDFERRFGVQCGLLSGYANSKSRDALPAFF